MVKIKWEITDTIEGISLNEFNTEWNGIYGYFAIFVNKQVLGFCPNRKLFDNEEGNENILYWLFKLADGIIQLNSNQEYKIELLSMNLAKVIIKRNENLLLSFLNSKTNEIIWIEEIREQELYDEVVLNIEKFIIEIKKQNSVLLRSNLIKQLAKTKNALNCITG